MKFKAILFLFLFAVTFSSIAQDINIVSCKVTTLRKDTLKLIDTFSQAHFIIFSNNNACRNCFRPFNRPSNSVLSKIKNASLKIKFLCRVEMSSSIRRQHINTLKIEVPNLANDSSIFFDIYSDEYIYNEIAKSGVFGHYKVLHTPVALLYEPDFGFMYFSYAILNGYLKNADKFSIEELKKYSDNLK